MSSYNIESFKSNLLLATFSDADLERLAPHLRPYQFTGKMVLFPDQSDHDRSYFPHSGLFSLLLTSRNNENIEVNVVGHDGVINLLAVLGKQPTYGRCKVLIAGGGWYLSGAIMRKEYACNRTFRCTLLHCLNLWLDFARHNILCNGIHPLEMRLCRWLLTIQDRTGTHILELSISSLSALLGASVLDVTLAAGVLAEAGCIDYGRCYVVIMDREALESRCCECYSTMRRQCETFNFLPAFNLDKEDGQSGF